MGIKYEINENFFDVWSSEMAYVLGFLYADGSLEDSPYIRAKYVRVSSTDKSIIELIRSAMKSEHTIVTDMRQLPRKPSHLLRIGSHYMYRSLANYGLHPHKSLTMTMPHIPVSFLPDFTRGYFDGDGCVFIERARGKTQPVIMKRLLTVFTCGSRQFLEQLADNLHVSFGLSARSLYFNQRAYRLQYSTKDSIRLFQIMYTRASNLFLTRKFATFRQYFTLRPSAVTPSISSILKR